MWCNFTSVAQALLSWGKAGSIAMKFLLMVWSPYVIVVGLNSFLWFYLSLTNHFFFCPLIILCIFSFRFSDICFFQQNPSNVAPALNLCCCPLPPEPMEDITCLPAIQHSEELTSVTFLNAGWWLFPTAMLRFVFQGVVLEDKSAQVIWAVMTPCPIGAGSTFPVLH